MEISCPCVIKSNSQGNLLSMARKATAIYKPTPPYLLHIRQVNQTTTQNDCSCSLRPTSPAASATGHPADVHDPRLWLRLRLWIHLSVNSHAYGIAATVLSPSTGSFHSGYGAAFHGRRGGAPTHDGS